MKITDRQNEKQEVSYRNLIAGSVYVDVYHGTYIIATDDKNVNLESGCVYLEEGYPDGAVFIPLEAHLEVR